MTVQAVPGEALALRSTGAAAHAGETARSASAVADRAVDFELRDQYNQLISYRFPKSKPTILIFGDRKGSEQIEGWVRPIWAQYQDRVDQRGVAVLSAVPSFMRGIIRSMFKSRVKYPVLLDWTGEVAKSYHYQSGQANLILIDQQGQIVLRLSGGAGKDGLQQLYARIDRLLTVS
ncbi:MAG: TlpA family protein disulfide reductase [Acidobacteriota bacterium]